MLQKHCFAENLQNHAPSQKQIASYKCNYNTWMHSFMLLWHEEVNGAHFCHDPRAEKQSIWHIKFSWLSARWQEISERFETRSIERGTTQLHHHIVKVCYLFFSWLVGRVKSKKSQKSRYSVRKAALYKNHNRHWP